MQNPYHYRTVVNRLWRIANGPHPGYICLRALDALAGDFTPHSPRFAIAQQMLRAVDPYEYARHLLRDLYDRADPFDHSQATDLTLLQEEELSEEDDDPL